MMNHNNTPPPVPPSAVAGKQCKKCMQWIDPKASVCPHCRSKQGMGCLAMLGLAVLAAFVGSIMLGVVLGERGVTSPPKKTRSVPGKVKSSVTTQPSHPAELDVTPPQKTKRPAARNTVSENVEYSIINVDLVSNIKRSVNVRINRRITKNALRPIALKLKAADRKQYKRTFICYYLPGMIVGTGAWATSHFNPDLDVRILGLTLEEANTLIEKPIPADWDVIGRWFDQNIFFGGPITIFRKNGKLYYDQKFKDIPKFTVEVIETQTQLGRRFDLVAGIKNGAHWVIGRDGNLLIRDNGGLISTAMPIKKAGGR